MKPSGHLVIGLRDEASSRDALATARLLGDALSLTLRGLLGLDVEEVAEAVRRLRLPGDALRGVVLELAGEELAAALVRASTDPACAYVVIARDSPESGAPLRVGPVAERVLRSATCPVVVVPPDAARPALRAILLPLDGTPSTAEAIRPVGELLRGARARLDIAFVGVTGADAQPAREPGAMTTPQYVDQPQHEWAAFSSEFLDRFSFAIGHTPPEVPTRLFLGAGDPGDEILRFARELESDLVVLVWAARVDERHGAVVRQILEHSPCPVLVLRKPPAG